MKIELQCHQNIFNLFNRSNVRCYLLVKCQRLLHAIYNEGDIFIADNRHHVNFIIHIFKYIINLYIVSSYQLFISPFINFLIGNTFSDYSFKC